MSNDQPQAKTFFTSIILVVPPSSNQKEAASLFLESQLKIKFTPNSPQLRWLNEQQATISIETIRNLINELSYAAHLNKTRAFVLLFSEKLSTAAQHALLKSLEEPPLNTQLMLATSQPNELLQTIRSRCVTHYFGNSVKPIANFSIPPILQTLFTNPQTSNYSELIKLAEEYKDREQASQLMQQLLTSLHQQPQTSHSRHLQIQQILLKTLQNLTANSNVRLALEHCFFTIKD